MPIIIRRDRKVLPRGVKREIEIDENILPDHLQFVKDATKKEDEANGKFGSSSEYGHAAMNLVAIMVRSAALSQEEQRQQLKEYAQELVSKYGPGIINFLREELRLALEE